jgi:uncharacterized protein YndB with AHSA1/START domain
MNDTVHMNDTVVAEIDIDAPPERVFQAWIDPQQRLAWWGDESTYRCRTMESDVRVGGRWRTEGKNVEGKPFAVWGEYTRIDPPNALAFTWNHDWGDNTLPQTHVLIELTATSSGTHVAVTHTGFVSAASRDDHGKGWRRVLGWLGAYMQRR